MRDSHLKRHYGISLEDYNVLLEKQKGLCAICKRKELHQRWKCLSVDHNHKTGEVRGLLCHRCNVVLGYANDINVLIMAIKYLKKRGN